MEHDEWADWRWPQFVERVESEIRRRWSGPPAVGLVDRSCLLLDLMLEGAAQANVAGEDFNAVSSELLRVVVTAAEASLISDPLREALDEQRAAAVRAAYRTGPA